MHKFGPFREALARVLPRFGVARVRNVQDVWLRRPLKSPTYWLGAVWRRQLMRRFVTTDHFYMPTSAYDTGWEDPLLAAARGLSGGSLEIGVHPGFDEPWRSDERETVQRLAGRARGRGAHARTVDRGRLTTASTSRAASRSSRRSASRWERLQGRHFATDPDVFPSILGRQGAVRPHAIALERDGEPRTLVLARVEDIRLTTKLGYTTVYKPQGARAHRRLPRRARRARRRGRAAGARRAPPRARHRRGRRAAPSQPRGRHAAPPRRDGDAARLARAQHARRPSTGSSPCPTPTTRFSSSLSRSTRESTKRYPKKLEKQFGDRLASRSSATSPTASASSTDLRPRRPKTYQHGLGVAFAQTELQRRLTTLTMERGWFRAYLLSLDGEPIAFWQGQAYRGVFPTGVPGFDPAYADLRVGNYVLCG